MSTTPKYAERIKPIWDKFKSIEKNVYMPNRNFIEHLKALIKKSINKAYEDGFNAGLKEFDRRKKEIELDKE